MKRVYGDAPYGIRRSGFEGSMDMASMDTASTGLTMDAGNDFLTGASVATSSAGSGSGMENVDLGKLLPALQASAGKVKDFFVNLVNRRRADGRAGTRDQAGWGDKVEIPGNLVTPWGDTGMWYEIGDWGTYTGSDGKPYTGFQAWLLDAKGNRIKRLSLSTRYAAVNEDGTILNQANYGPWDSFAITDVYKVKPTADGMDQVAIPQGRWGIDPPKNYTPFTGFALKSDVLAALKSGGALPQFGAAPGSPGSPGAPGTPNPTPGKGDGKEEEEGGMTTLIWVIIIAAVIIAIILIIKFK